MTVKELIIELLECELNGEVCIEYPNNSLSEDGNYCRYNQANYFSINDYIGGVVIGIRDEI